MSTLIFAAIYTVMFIGYTVLLLKGIKTAFGAALVGLCVGVIYTIPIMHIFGVFGG